MPNTLCTCHTCTPALHTFAHYFVCFFPIHTLPHHHYPHDTCRHALDLHTPFPCATACAILHTCIFVLLPLLPTHLPLCLFCHLLATFYTHFTPFHAHHCLCIYLCLPARHHLHTTTGILCIYHCHHSPAPQDRDDGSRTGETDGADGRTVDQSVEDHGTGLGLVSPHTLPPLHTHHTHLSLSFLPFLCCLLFYPSPSLPLPPTADGGIELLTSTAAADDIILNLDWLADIVGTHDR